MKSAPFCPNSSFARSHGSCPNGAGKRSGSGACSRALRCWMRYPAAYSGLRARHRACVCCRRAFWHAAWLQACCRAPTRGWGRNQWWQIEQGLFRGAGIVSHHGHARPLCPARGELPGDAFRGISAAPIPRRNTPTLFRFAPWVISGKQRWANSGERRRDRSRHRSQQSSLAQLCSSFVIERTPRQFQRGRFWPAA